MKKPKTAEIQYIESGTYVGGEEEASCDMKLEINDKAKLLVIRKSDFDKLWTLADFGQKHLKMMERRLQSEPTTQPNQQTRKLP